MPFLSTISSLSSKLLSTWMLFWSFDFSETIFSDDKKLRILLKSLWGPWFNNSPFSITSLYVDLRRELFGSKRQLLGNLSEFAPMFTSSFTVSKWLPMMANSKGENLSDLKLGSSSYTVTSCTTIWVRPLSADIWEKNIYLGSIPEPGEYHTYLPLKESSHI